MVKLEDCLILNDYPEIFKGGQKLGVIFDNLCLAYITGYIFYFLTVHLKAEKDKRNYNERLGIITNRILTSTDILVSTIVNQNIKSSKLEYSRKNIFYSCPKINIYEKGVISWIDGTEGNWLDFLYHYMKDIQSDMRTLNGMIMYLEPEHSKLLGRIEDAGFLKQIQASYYTPSWIPDQTLSIFATSIVLYMNLIEDLRQYTNENLKDYLHHTSESIGYRYSQTQEN